MTDLSKERASSIGRAFVTLYELALYLRSSRGCPWDREQDLESMQKCLSEEATELEEAIAAANPAGISEEWGDVLFMLLMLAVIGEQEGTFDTAEAMRSIEAKMIRRHPHVFGGSDVESLESLIEQWERIKAEEKKEVSDSVMENLPSFYSALKRADHVQKAAAEVGFDWPDGEGVLKKIEEEVDELRKAFAAGDLQETADEVGDLLFSCVNFARFVKLDSEALLNRTIEKFIKRFKYIESELHRAGTSLQDATLEDMDALWEESKYELP